MRGIIFAHLLCSVANAAVHIPDMDSAVGAISPTLYFEHKYGSYYMANDIFADYIPAAYCRENKVVIMIWIGAVHDDQPTWLQLNSIEVGPDVTYDEKGRMCNFKKSIKLTVDNLHPLLNKMSAVLYIKQSADALVPDSPEPLTPLNPAMADSTWLHRDRAAQWSSASWIVDADLPSRSDEQKFLVAAVNGALSYASLNQSRNTGLRNGFSGDTFRHLLNNLGSLVGVRYLEVGTFNGSSLFAFVEGNEATIGRAVAIDNWDQSNLSYLIGTAQDVRNDVMSALQSHGFDSFISVIERNCWDVSAAEVVSKLGGKAHIYFYDAGHSVVDQYVALPHFLSALEDTFILIVDDWSWTSVKRGTYSALRSMPVEIISELSINTVVCYPEFNTQWHNGVGIFVLQKL